MTFQSLLALHCQPRKGKEAGVPADELDGLLAQLPSWQLDADNAAISKEFQFRDYFHTMAFVNAVASIAHREDHHPDMEVHYNRCLVTYSTHDVGGLSLNDFICAARVEDLRAAG
ncbi:4a-hydroxytetrahydrobiopterin dehydratase [Dokdonella sp.]|uniref:4a-hydroxytetrahydrobiopterin dehydratase n=1 Tax=Dokdonella sp. TaxID=2291710 RepID=UPI0031C57795|nr:4a-hydroxytetrahydrobiopterin dehydratase [Dokdonella sp.]